MQLVSVFLPQLLELVLTMVDERARETAPQLASLSRGATCAVAGSRCVLAERAATAPDSVPLLRTRY